jgi:predicted ATPase
MPKIEGFRVKNYKALRDITLGKLWNTQKAKPLSPLTVVIGKNGVGKTTLFDAFGFLADCLKDGVEEACNARGRGGFEWIRSQGRTEAIEFEVYYKEDEGTRPITYEVTIDLDASRRPYVRRERLRQRRKGQSKGRPFSFLILDDGKGVAWKGADALGEDVKEDEKDFNLFSYMEELERETKTEESRETEVVELDNSRKLGIATIGSLKQHPRISAFRRFIESWHLSYFTPGAARGVPLAGPQRHLNVHGGNLANVVQFMQRDHEKSFQSILKKISEKIPGVDKIDVDKSRDGRLLLQFNDKGFKDPFYAQQMSDGTLTVFAYLLMLADPSPPPFLCIEEPENGLYHKLLEMLAREFREHATGRRSRSQVFITTHQPYLVNALEPKEVWILTKGDDGFSKIERASDNPLIQNLVDEGLPLGGLWYSDYLDER